MEMIRHLDSTLYKVSGDIVFIVKIALFRLKINNHVHYYLAHAGLLYPNDCLKLGLADSTTPT